MSQDPKVPRSRTSCGCRIGILLALLALPLACAVAQTEWEVHRDIGIRSLWFGDYPAAIEAFEYAAQYARSLDDPERDEMLADSLTSLGEVHMSLADYTKAETLIREGLALREAFHGGNHEKVADSLSVQARLRYEQGRIEQALRLLGRVLAIRQGKLGPRHHTVASTLNFIASLHNEMGRKRSAEFYFRRALQTGAQAFGSGDEFNPNALAAATLNNLAVLYVSTDRLAEAEQLFLKVREIQGNWLEPDHPEVARTLRNLGIVYRIRGRWPESEEKLSRAIELREKALGAQHPYLAEDLDERAFLYRDQGRLDEAEAGFARAAMIREQVYPRHHRAVAVSFWNLASVYLERGRLDVAESSIDIAVGTLATGPSTRTPYLGRLFMTLAKVRAAAGRTVEAHAALDTARDLLDLQDVPSLLDDARLLDIRASLLESEGRFTAAREHRERVLAIRESVLGAQHPLVSASREALGGVRDAGGGEARAGTRQQPAPARPETAPSAPAGTAADR